jgi:predicted negative regulator of RcsB-dependent stress response
MKTTNLLIFSALLCLVVLPFAALSQQITTPRTPSPAAQVIQTIGISTVSVKYSRPSVKGRKVWGELVPFGWNDPGNNNGPSPWRAGANENTVLTLSHDATIEGKKVPAGQYGFFLVINQDNSGEVVLSKDYRSWGHFHYNPAQDQMRAPITTRDHEMTELLTYEFINLTKTSAELILNWEKKQFPVKIEFDVDNIVMANATQELMGLSGFTWQGNMSAANYAVNNKVNLEQAGKWADQAVNIARNFQTLQTKANVLRATGKTEDADKLMKDAVAVGTENDINVYGYNLMNQGQIDKAIEIFTINTTKFPASANTFDSLGEAYVGKGDNKNAIKNFKKALTLNPPAATKANSEKYLKQLGAM